MAQIHWCVQPNGHFSRIGCQLVPKDDLRYTEVTFERQYWGLRRGSSLESHKGAREMRGRDYMYNEGKPGDANIGPGLRQRPSMTHQKTSKNMCVLIHFNFSKCLGYFVKQKSNWSDEDPKSTKILTYSKIIASFLIGGTSFIVTRGDGVKPKLMVFSK